MKHDLALATALAASFGYVIVVGAVTSSRTATSLSPYAPVSMRVTLKDTGRVVEITDPQVLASLSVWLDRAFEHPRSMFDLQVFSPPSNELDITFASGDQTRLFFSGTGHRHPAAPLENAGAMAPASDAGRVVIQYEGNYYIARELPEYFRDDRSDPPPGAAPPVDA